MSEQSDEQDEQDDIVVETIEGLSLEEQAVNFDTMRHIEMVRNFLAFMAIKLLERGKKHDQSKLVSPEVEGFARATAELKDLTYDSAEYKASKKRLETVLKHHYANNRHHPEHFKNGINDMNILDILEMFCDWAASSTRHHDGNLRKSIEINGERFEMSAQLVRIFENTMELISEAKE